MVTQKQNHKQDKLESFKNLANQSPAPQQGFNLSEKRIFLNDYESPIYLEETIKEFIRLLKKQLMKIKSVNYDWNVEGTINQLSGKDLI